MAEAVKDEEVVQLATKVPRGLLKAVKVRCIETDVAMQDFVAAALRDRLAAKSA